VAPPEIFAGFPPGGGGTQFMARLLGPAKALELCLTGRRVYGDEAERIGLANKACDPDDLMPAAMAFARELAAKSTVGIKNVKKAIYEGLDMTLLNGMIRERELFYNSLREPGTLELMKLYVGMGQDSHNRDKILELLREKSASS
jgi:enoyl-CoA hydratase